jgi:hypothetical protein
VHLVNISYRGRHRTEYALFQKAIRQEEVSLEQLIEEDVEEAQEAAEEEQMHVQKCGCPRVAYHIVRAQPNDTIAALVGFLRRV